MVKTPSVSEQLVSHLAKFRDGAWDDAVRRRTGLCLLDSLACFSAGRSLKHYEPSAKVAIALFGLNEQAAPSPFAKAYLYGQAANALDYDDTLMIGHPGAPIIGAVLSVAARDNLTTDRLLRGIAAGYEVEMILGASALPSPERALLVRSVGVWDTVAGAIGIGAALGFDDEMLERAIGVAVAHSLLPYTAKWYERPVPAVKNNLGWAAAGAVLSADLTLAGQTGVTNPLEGENAMWRMAGSDQWRFNRELFTKPAVLRAGFKHSPVCWHIQAWLKSFSALLAQMPLTNDVAEIVVKAPQNMERFCKKELLSTADIAFSLPASFSLLISGLEPGPEWDRLEPNDPRFQHREAFRFERAEEQSISIRTHAGEVLTSAVIESDYFDRAATGLDEAGVWPSIDG